MQRARPRSRLWVGTAVLGGLSLVIAWTTVARSRHLVSLDNVRLVLAPAGGAPAGADDPARAVRARAARWEEALARLRIEIGEFHESAWPARVAGCQHFPPAFFERMAGAVERGANATFATAATHPRWLTPERMAAAADAEGVLFVTWANAHFADFVENFVVSLQKLRLHNVLVGALDDELVGLLGREGGPVPRSAVFRMLADEALETGAREHWGWGSPKFNQMGVHKGVLMRSALAMGVTLLLCDVDTVWLRDPRPLLGAYSHVDLLISTDTLAPSRTRAAPDAPFVSTDGGLERALTDIGHAPHYQLLLTRSNIGVMLLRPTLVRRARARALRARAPRADP